MPGIIVGVDGSGHSQRALEWGIKEAAVRQVPLTVLTVHEAVRGYYTAVPVVFSGDEDRTVETQVAAQKETDEVLAKIDGPHPESVTVTAIHGFPVQELIKAGEDADLIVLGSRGAGGFTRLMMGSTAGQVVQHSHVPVVIIPPEDRN